jgi:2-amino-4-hydroxy-6-hydroxymethyldihydropteridine diphosphokinase
MSIALLGFGANLGSPEQKFLDTVDALRKHSQVTSVAASRLIASEPIGGPPDQPLYFNGAIRATTAMSPQDFFSLTSEIETSLGRVREVQWGPREIDLDLVLFDDLELQTPSLILPHPRFHFRRFALAPAVEIAPDMVHPVFGLRVSELLSHLDRIPRITAIAGSDPAFLRAFANEVATRTNTLLVDRAVLDSSSLPSEFITTLNETTSQEIPPQLVVWIGEGEIPRELRRQLLDSAFPTWISVNSLQPAAAMSEAAAAVAAMRPFA